MDKGNSIANTGINEPGPPICKIDCIHLVLCRESQNVLGGCFRVIQGNTILQRISCSDSLICGGNCTQSPLVVDDRVIVDTASIAEDATFGAESGQLLPDGNLVVEIGEIREEKNLSPLPGVDAFGYFFCGLHWFLFCHKNNAIM